MAADFINAANIVTCLWLALWAAFAFRCIFSGVRHSILYIIIAHFFFSGLPLALDVFLGTPDYFYFRGLALATRDAATSVTYCIYVSICPVLWWLSGRPGRKKSADPVDEAFAWALVDDPNLMRRWRPLFYVMIFSVPLMVMLSPYRWVYYDYAYLQERVFSHFRALQILEYHSIINNLTMVGLIGAAGLLATSRRIRTSLLLLAPWFFLNSWVNGKRYIIAVTTMIVGYILWVRGYLNRRRLIYIGIPVILLFIGYSFWYQAKVRGVTVRSRSTAGVYQKLRIDFGRDDVIKMALFAELNPHTVRILEYRCQSIFYYLILYVPRRIWPRGWPKKPMAYTRYNISAMRLIPPKAESWAITTSWLGEAIANFSWFGVLLGPLLLSLICRVGDARGDPFVKALTTLIGVLFLSTALGTFQALFLLWIFFVWQQRRWA